MTNNNGLMLVLGIASIIAISASAYKINQDIKKETRESEAISQIKSDYYNIEAFCSYNSVGLNGVDCGKAIQDFRKHLDELAGIRK